MKSKSIRENGIRIWYNNFVWRTLADINIMKASSTVMLRRPQNQFYLAHFFMLNNLMMLDFTHFNAYMEINELKVKVLKCSILSGQLTFQVDKVCGCRWQDFQLQNWPLPTFKCALQHGKQIKPLKESLISLIDILKIAKILRTRFWHIFERNFNFESFLKLI